MRRILLFSATTALLLATGLAAADRAARPRARVGRSMKNDTSPPLRDLRPVPPRRRVRTREMPKPRPTAAGEPARTGIDAVAQTEVDIGPLAVSSPLVSFEGIDNVSGVLPPDTNGDVGPAHFVQMVNSAFQIWDKTGVSLYGPADLSTIWSGFGLPCENTNDGDPVVLYDSIADRWLLSQFVASASPSFGECVAISQTGDPTGAYHRYYVPLSTTIFYDYPHFGVWPDAYYFGANKFDANGYAGSAVIALERDQMLAGLPAGVQEFATSQSGTPYPADHDGVPLPPANAPNYVAQRPSGTNDVLNVYEFHVDWTTPASSTFTGPTQLAVATYDLAACGNSLACVPQPNTSVQLDTLGDRLMHRFAYRNFGTHESMVVNHTVGLSETGGGPPREWSGVRWYEVRRPAGLLTLHQQGTYAQGGPSADYTWRWMGSIAMDGAGNIGLGYSVSDDSPQVFPGIRYTGRLAGDAPGTMQAEATLIAGGGSQLNSLSRWGDYSSMSIDPEDDCTFWYTNEYYTATSDADWQTRIGAFDLGPGTCTPTPKGEIAGTVKDAQDLVSLPGVLVEADNGHSTLTNGGGAYSLILSPGSYDVTASAPDRACDPATQTGVVVVADDTTTLDFDLTGDPLLAAGGHAIDDSGGNDNGKVNRDECFEMSLTVVNDGCRKATAVSAVLSTSTPGVTVTQPNSNYPDLAIGAGGVNLTPFGVLTSSSFACGTDIVFTLTLAMAEGPNQQAQFTVPTCDLVTGGAITAGDPTIANRLGRAQPPSSCGAPKACPGGIETQPSPDSYRYDTHTFTNTTGASACFTVTLDPLTCTGANQLHSSAYLGVFNPANVCTNFLADNGFDPTAVTSYSFTVPNGQLVTVVVNAAAADQTCAAYTLTISKVDNASGGGACGGGAPSMTPTGLVVDETGNDVLELGETAVFAPAWENVGTAAANGLAGAASAFQTSPSTPATATYTLNDSAASYGDVAVTDTAACTDDPDDAGECYEGTVTPPVSRSLHWDAEFLETLSTGHTKTWNLHVGESFADTPTSQAFYRSIETLLHGGRTGGCGGFAYCPTDPVTRAQAAYLLLRAKEGPSYTPPTCSPGGEMFPDDVPESDGYCPWVEEAATRQIMSACSGDGQSFCPDIAVTREQMAVYLLRTDEGVGFVPPVCVDGDEPYTDVDDASLYCRWIQEAEARGITVGCGGGNYCPAGAVDRDVMAAFLERTFALTLYAP